MAVTVTMPASATSALGTWTSLWNAGVCVCVCCVECSQSGGHPIQECCL